MLLEAFLISNSVTSSFQCEIKGGIIIALNVGAVVIGQNDVKSDDFWGLGMSWENCQRDIYVVSLFDKWT